MIYAIGHSTRPLEKFIAILEAHGVVTLADIRTVPKSRHNPQFNEAILRKTLPKRGIRYAHLERLGGLRHPRKDSVNTAWRNASFRGYADYMQTEEFEKGLRELIALARREPTAIMCAEGNRFRCHRSLVADALVARGIPVLHISGLRGGVPHQMTEFAKIRAGKVTYSSP